MAEWIRTGAIEARKIGGSWYIDLDAFESKTGNPLADRILEAAA